MKKLKNNHSKVVFDTIHKLYKEVIAVISKPKDSFDDTLQWFKKIGKILVIRGIHVVKKPVFQ